MKTFEFTVGYEVEKTFMVKAETQEAAEELLREQLYDRTPDDVMGGIDVINRRLYWDGKEPNSIFFNREVPEEEAAQHECLEED